MAFVLTQSQGGIDYTSVAPLNFAHKTKIWEFNPIGTFNNSLNSNDVVRFNVASDHYWDPWSCFIDLTIDVSNNERLIDDATFKWKVLQLDSSAQSFWKSLVITENSVELERIGDLDVLASWLKDCSYNTDDRYQRDYEGLGGAMGSSFHTSTFGAGKSRENDVDERFPIRYWIPSRDLNSFTGGGTNKNLNFAGLPYPANAADPYKPANGDKADVTEQGQFYTRNHIQNMTQSAFQPCYGKQNMIFSGSQADNLWNVDEYVANFNDDSVTDAIKRTKYDPTFIGPAVPYSPAFALNGFEPVFSKTVKQRYLKNGYVATGAITTLNFQVPLLSCHFGHLVAPNNYKLVPLKYFRDLVFELQFSPHALFTSWWNTDSSARQYTVKSLKLRTELVQITDAAIIAQHDAIYNNGGIRIASQGYYQGPGYQIINGAVPPTLQINLGFESLRTVLFGFQPNDHTSNTCCRKQYRLSMAITSMALKVGTDYFPQIPITGNGGNNIGPLNNNEYLKYLWKAFTKLGNPGNSIINPHNFAVNCRAVDPTAPLADTNISGAQQMCYFEENRVIGKAVYAIPLDALNYNNTLLSGLNTTAAKPFELNLQCDNSRTFNRSVQMYTYFYHDCVLYIGPDGIRTHGRT